ncbi:outer membrane beta-barrel protein [Marilutibacter maris]|uniref:outer membrane beta-barrel protein n=1 Tax=Marilutibacter maris TaxID=1605891 RepID=UPI000DA92AA1|nr:outer membrane beta-barrel protein [Lysobacter maris]
MSLSTLSRAPLLATLAAALGLALAAPAAQAADNQRGFYAGAGVGQSLVDEGRYDDEDTAFSAFGGYQFNRYFALEAGYADFGELESRDVGGDLEASSGYLVAVGSVPFGANLSGYAKAGLHRWDLDSALPAVIGGRDDSGTDPTYGIGLQYRFNDSLALRGEYSRFEIEDADLDLAQLQLRFDF